MSDTDAFSALDSLVADNPPRGEPTDQAPPEPPKPGAKVVEPAKDTPPPAPAAPKADTKPPERAATLRANYDRLKGEYAALEKKHKELESKVSKPSDDPEKKSLSEKVSAYEKKLQELNDQLRFTSYERSQDYKDKYETPFINAYATGREKVASLKIKLPDQVDSDTGEVIKAGDVRNGTPEDFDTLMRISNDDDAAEFASKTFGSKAPTVLYHREKVQELNASRLRALEEFKKSGAEREKQQAEMAEKQKKEFLDQWESANKSAVERYPAYFKPEDGDEKGNMLLEKGFQMADLAFNSEQLPPSERVRVLSAIRNKAAGFDRMVYKNTKLQAEIKELRDKLKEFEESVPGPGDGGGRTQPATDDSMEGILAGLDKIATPM